MAQASTKQRKKPFRAGGAATAGGMNFQASVTAIACSHLLADRPLNWLPGLVADTPDRIEAETGGSGDDIGIVLQGGDTVEVQVKKGLSKGNKLWWTLESLARGIASGSCDYGVLVVCPNSSANIRVKLAQDIERLGDGRSDSLTDIGAEWLKYLSDMGLDPAKICHQLRVQTVSAIKANQASIQAAQALLETIVDSQRDVSRVWDLLFKDASELIERRGQRDTGSLTKCIRAANIPMRDGIDGNRTLMLGKISDWNHKSHAHFSVLGLDHKFDIDEDWIELTAVVSGSKGQKPVDAPDFAKALADYHDWKRAGSDNEQTGPNQRGRSVDPETLGRFVKRGIVLAGPGIGKTTLLNRIVRRYSEDCIPLLRVRLRSVAASMRAGKSFEQAVFELGLDGSGLSIANTRAANFGNWLLLGDGLDECGDMQADVAAGVERFSLGFPHSHIIVTSRPIGYEAGHFSDWRHYDLLPLDPSYAAENVLSLLRSLSDDERVLEDYKRRCDRELRRSNTEIRDIVGRTPMMVGLAASILAGGRSLGTSRQELFEQIFVLIDEMPKRALSKPAGQAILSRFLDIAGWQITRDPLLDRKDLVKECATSLAALTGETPLVAAEKAEKYLHYWEDVGLIEAIGLGVSTICCFTHKSIGEYAAARHFCNEDMDGLRSELPNVIDDPKWDETLHFASNLGIADRIARAILASFESVPGEPRKALHLARLLSDSPARLDHELLSDILKRIAGVLQTGSGDYAEIGLPLARAAAAYPAEIAAMAKDFLDSEHVWVRLTAWNSLLAAGSEHLKLDDLTRMLPKLVEAGVGVKKRRLGGGIRGFRLSPDRRLTEELALSGCSYIGDHGSPETVDAVVPGILQHEQLSSISFLEKAERLIREKGWTFSAYRPSSDILSSKRNLFDIPEGYRKAQYIAELFWLDALGAREIVEGEDVKPAPLLTLSAFAQASYYWDQPANCVWAWTEDFDPGPARATIQTFARVCELDGSVLRSEAIAAKQYLLAGRGKPDEWRHSPLHQLSQVDCPDIDWSRVDEIEIDTAMLEQALYHPSRWIVWMAATILESKLDADALQACVTRLLADGAGYALLAAGGLAEKLPGRSGVDLVVERLKQEFKWGERHLFEMLDRSNHKPLCSAEDMLAILENGLFAHVWTAQSAAKLLLKRAEAGQRELLPLIDDAFVHWLEHEEPYPTGGGVIPDSPRSELAKARLTIEAPDYERAKLYLSDRRGDVSEVGRSALVELFEVQHDAFGPFLADIIGGKLGTSTLSFVLSNLDSLPADDTDRVLLLLDHEDENFRFAAMAILDRKYLNPDQIRMQLDELLDDPVEDIRECAKRAISLLTV